MSKNSNANAFQCRQLDKQEHAALKSLYAGDASPDQQRLALNVIVNVFCRAHDLLYVPGSFDQSAFLNGRAFPGQKILKYLNLPVGKLKQQEDNDGDDRP